jgi:hypothetical protein
MTVHKKTIRDAILFILIGIVLVAYHTWIFYSYTILDMIRVEVRLFAPLMLILLFKKYYFPQKAKILFYLYSLLVLYLLLIWAFSEGSAVMAVQTAKNLYVLVFCAALLLILHPKQFSYRFLYITPYLGLLFSIQAIGLTGLNLIGKFPSSYTTYLSGLDGRPVISYGIWGYGLAPLNLVYGVVVRAQGFFGEPTALASFLEVAAIMSLGLYKVNNDKKMLMVFILCGIAIVLTFSPTVYVVMFVVVSIYYYLAHFQRTSYLRPVLLTGSVLVVITGIVYFIMFITGSFYGSSSLGGLLGKTTHDISIRVRFVWDSLYMLFEHPLGIGFYGLDHPTATRMDLLFGGMIAPLLWLVRGGVVTLGIQLCIIFSLMRNIVIKQIRMRGRIERYIGLSFIALLLHDCVAGDWFSVLFFYLVACVIVTDTYRFSGKVT